MRLTKNTHRSFLVWLIVKVNISNACCRENVWWLFTASPTTAACEAAHTHMFHLYLCLDRQGHLEQGRGRCCWWWVEWWDGCVCVWLLLFDLPFRSGKSRMSGCTESQKTGKRCLFLFCHYSQVLRPVHWVFCVVNWGAYFFFWIAFCLISAYTQTNFPLRQNAIFVFIHLKFNCFHSVDAVRATANQHPQCSGKTSHESQATYCLLIWELYVHICP